MSGIVVEGVLTTWTMGSAIYLDEGEPDMSDGMFVPLEICASQFYLSEKNVIPFIKLRRIL